MADIYDELRAERKHQDEKWGGPAHDDLHRGQDWYEFIDPRIERASFTEFAGGDRGRRLLIESASMLIAWIESLDRRIENESLPAQPEREGE